MTPLLAVTIDNSTLLLVLGALALIATIFSGITTPLGKGIAALGAIFLLFAFLLKGQTPAPLPPGPIPYPSPTPAPAPAPIPQPMSFAGGVVDAFKQDGGSADDAIVLSAMFDQYASSLEFDATQQPPRIVTANDLGNSFARLQKYKYLANQTPLGQRFPRFEAFIAAEMNRTGLSAGPLDSAKRTNAIYLLRTVSSSLRSM